MKDCVFERTLELLFKELVAKESETKIDPVKKIVYFGDLRIENVGVGKFKVSDYELGVELIVSGCGIEKVIVDGKELPIPEDIKNSKVLNEYLEEKIKNYKAVIKDYEEYNKTLTGGF
jgi:hypothetical protein